MGVKLSDVLAKFSGKRNFRGSVRSAFSCDEQLMYIRRVEQLIEDGRHAEQIETQNELAPEVPKFKGMI